MNQNYAKHWTLDPAVTFLNHGSFGACPRTVLNYQQQWRDRLERQPVHFLMRDIETALDESRNALASLVSANAQDLAFVTNATTGVNAVLRSLTFDPNDEILVTSHGYNACTNAAHYVLQRAGGRVTTAQIPFPINNPDQALQAILDAVTPNTKLAIIDHITSATALVLPIEKIVTELQSRGIDVLVDGAHAPGMVPIDLNKIKAAYYTGNFHKWLCTPKSAAFLHVRPDKQKNIRPTVISHGMNSPRTNRSRFLLEFDWTGTSDPTPILSLPKSLEFLSNLVEGGIEGLMKANRAMALQAQQILCQAMQVTPAAPPEMLGSMATITLPNETDTEAFPPTCDPTLNPVAPLQNALLQKYAIEVPIMNFPAPPNRQVRISAQIYNDTQDYHDLAAALVDLLGQ